MREQKKWFGTWPADCDGCKADLRDSEYFCDAARAYGRIDELRGLWGLWCPDCHKLFCAGRLGTGFGQKYDSRTLIKLEG